MKIQLVLFWLVTSCGLVACYQFVVFWIVVTFGLAACYQLLAFWHVIYPVVWKLITKISVFQFSLGNGSSHY